MWCFPGSSLPLANRGVYGYDQLDRVFVHGGVCFRGCARAHTWKVARGQTSPLCAQVHAGARSASYKIMAKLFKIETRIKIVLIIDLRDFLVPNSDCPSLSYRDINHTASIWPTVRMRTGETDAACRTSASILSSIGREAQKFRKPRSKLRAKWRAGSHLLKMTCIILGVRSAQKQVSLHSTGRS